MNKDSPLSASESFECVFILDHAYENEFGDEQSKLIGVYTSKRRAQAAIKRMKIKEGFRKYPDEFIISKVKINREYWEEGFISISEAMGSKSAGPEVSCTATDVS